MFTTFIRLMFLFAAAVTAIAAVLCAGCSDNGIAKAIADSALANGGNNNGGGGSNTFTDGRDKQTYKTVQIGGYTWMAENLNYGGSGRCYGDAANCKGYGRLYSFYEAKEACPTRWHLPNYSEWYDLINAAGGMEAAGKNLKSKSGWQGDGNGTDSLGFSALPGGSYCAVCVSLDKYGHLGEAGEWWTAGTPDKYDRVYRVRMGSGGNDVDFQENVTSMAYSVRCVK